MEDREGLVAGVNLRLVGSGQCMVLVFSNAA